jgi:hypothetical protein
MAAASSTSRSGGSNTWMDGLHRGLVLGAGHARADGGGHGLPLPRHGARKLFGVRAGDRSARAAPARAGAFAAPRAPRAPGAPGPATTRTQRTGRSSMGYERPLSSSVSSGTARERLNSRLGLRQQLARRMVLPRSRKPMPGGIQPALRRGGEHQATRVERPAQRLATHRVRLLEERNRLGHAPEPYEHRAARSQHGRGSREPCMCGGRRAARLLLRPGTPHGRHPSAAFLAPSAPAHHPQQRSNFSYARAQPIHARYRLSVTCSSSRAILCGLRMA